MVKTERFWIRCSPAWRELSRGLAKQWECTEAEAVRAAVTRAAVFPYGSRRDGALVTEDAPKETA